MRDRVERVFWILAGIGGLSMAANLATALVLIALESSGVAPLGPPPWLFVWLAATAVYGVALGAALLMWAVISANWEQSR